MVFCEFKLTIEQLNMKQLFSRTANKGFLSAWKISHKANCKKSILAELKLLLCKSKMACNYSRAPQVHDNSQTLFNMKYQQTEKQKQWALPHKV